MTARYHRALRDDTGASLVLALTLTTFLGLVVGALLTYASVSVRAGKSADTRQARTYDADGALKTAVNQVRTSTFNNDPGQSCPDVTVPGADAAGTRVTCTAKPGTGGASESVPITPANRPDQAVLTLGTTAGEPGVAQTGTGAFRVQGKVFSSGTITAGAGSVESVNASVTARGTCTGTVVSRNAAGATTPTVCSAPATAIPADPLYPQPATALTYRVLPTCDSGSTVEFEPGYYDDAVGLSALMNGTGSCAGKTFLFPPATGGVGIYYFDFHNGEGGGLPTTSRVWTINDSNAVVVGGTPLGWVRDGVRPSVPGACVSPLRSATGPGVQFVFGGDSRMSLTAGKVELCGQYSADSPPVTVYGAKSGADAVVGPATVATTGTGINPTNGPPFVNPARITATDGIASTASVNATSTTGPVIASVIVEGFAPSSTDIPPGSILTSAKLAVVHRENNAKKSDSLSLLQLSAVSTRTGAATLTNVPQPTIYQDGPSGGAFHTDTLDLLASLQTEVHTYGLPGLRVRYDAGAAPGDNVTENLDSIQLTLSWRLPAVRAQTAPVNGVANCITKYPSGCDLLEMGSTNTALFVQGTVYAPYAAVDLRTAATATAGVRSGLVVRAMQVQVAAAAVAGPVVEIPSDSTGPQPLEVFYRAYRAAAVVATARVRYPAPDPTATPTAGRRDVAVLSWTIRRR